MRFDRKTTIPDLLGTTLVLTGCGGDPPPQPTSLWGAAQEAFCMKMETCDPTPDNDGYLMKYEDEICQEEVLRYDLLAQDLTEECDALFASYFDCVTALPCDVLVRLNDYDLSSAELDACEEGVEMDEALLESCYSMLSPLF